MARPTRRFPRLAVVATALLLAASCGEHGEPVAPEVPSGAAGGGGRLELTLVCAADIRASTVSCSAPTPAAGGADPTLVVGGQGSYVELTSSNVTVAADTFSFDVTVQNLIPQPMGTTDGVTADPNGVRVFFDQLPTVTSGTGSIAVANADGVGTYTAANQPYYQYDGVLATNETSAAHPWKLTFDPGVDSFVFTVYVAAEVQYPNGWIDVTGGSNLLAGDTMTFTAVRRTAVGNVVPGDVTWGTTNSGVATVDSSGVITALEPGAVSITANAGGVSGVATLDVCPALEVGGVYTATMPTAARLCFGGGGAGAEYTYMPLNLSTSSSLALTVTGSGIQAVTGPPSPNRIPGGLAPLSPSFDVSPEMRHLQARATQIGSVAPLLSSRKARIGRSSGARFSISPGAPTLGDYWSLNVAQGCSGTPDLRTGQVRAISNHLIIVADTANPPGGFTTAQYDSIALEFDTIAYPAITDNFGEPFDADGNGRIVAFFTRAVNELSPPASPLVNNGYFTNRDLFSSDSISGCERSNAGEIMYMLVPDPTGVVNSNVRTVSAVRGTGIRTMGHELQHLVNASRRVYITGASAFEEPWLDEGLSRIAEELMFYRTSVGLAPRGNIVVTNLTTGTNASRRVAAFNTYANRNFGDLRGWLQRPDTTGAFNNNTTNAQQGALWAFLRYASDRVGGTETAFWSKLVDSNLEGKANLENAIGADPDAWLRDFTAAMYADDAVTGVAPEYTQPSWSFRSMYSALNGSYQLVPRALTNGVGLTLSYARGGGTSYTRFGVPASGFATLTALSGGAVPSSPFALVVVRTK
jgi:hypothetical protein